MFDCDSWAYVLKTFRVSEANYFTFHILNQLSCAHCRTPTRAMLLPVMSLLEAKNTMVVVCEPKSVDNIFVERVYKNCSITG